MDAHHARNEPGRSFSSRMAVANPIRNALWILFAQVSQRTAPPQALLSC
jgi:hypothetical protein